MLAAALLVVLADLSQFGYMDELRKTEQAVSETAASGLPRPFALQMLGLSQSYVTAPEFAAATWASAYPATPLTAEQSAENAERLRKVLQDFEPRDALPAIVAAARDRQIVIINEAHIAPRHRAFATLLALQLRPLGFEYLAVETLDNRTAERVIELEQRGYPLVEDGYYSKEPVFGDFLRRSLAAGFHPVAYEFTEYAGDRDKLSPYERQLQREAGQAQNIIDRVLEKNPRARILIHVGHGHVNKGLSEFDGRTIAMMAEQLRAKTGIDPLCIEQARYLQAGRKLRDQPLIDQVLQNYRGDSFVMASRAGTGYWHADGVDFEVWHRPAVLRQGREDWLALGGHRSPRRIPTELLPREGRRLVQAFVAGESADAVPIDQVLVTAGETPPVFMLPRGKFRYAWQD